MCQKAGVVVLQTNILQKIVVSLGIYFLEIRFWLIVVLMLKKQLVFTVLKLKSDQFTKGNKQLSKCEVDTARELSRVRIHVERIVGLLRQKYTILETTLQSCDND